MIADYSPPTMKTVFIDLPGFKNLEGLKVTVILSLADY
jgi:hypothetical protein